jgi:hypothetical protein
MKENMGMYVNFKTLPWHKSKTAQRKCKETQQIFYWYGNLGTEETDGVGISKYIYTYCILFHGLVQS